LRRIQRHHDGGRNAQQTGRQRYCLRVIAGGKRDHPCLALRRAEFRQRVVSAAKLESSHALQVLALEKHVGLQLAVGGGGTQHRRQVRLAVQAPRRGGNVVVGGKLEHGLGLV